MYVRPRDVYGTWERRVAGRTDTEDVRDPVLSRVLAGGVRPERRSEVFVVGLPLRQGRTKRRKGEVTRRAQRLPKRHGPFLRHLVSCTTLRTDLPLSVPLSSECGFGGVYTRVVLCLARRRRVWGRLGGRGV